MVKKWWITFYVTTAVLLPSMVSTSRAGSAFLNGLGLDTSWMDKWKNQSPPRFDGGREKGGVDQGEADRREAEKIAKYNSLIDQEKSAGARGDLREALRLARIRQGLIDGPNIRKYISELVDWIAADDALNLALAAAKKGDYEQAAGYYRQAMRNPYFDIPEYRQRAADLEDQAKRKRESKAAERASAEAERALRERERRDRPEAERLNNEVADLLKAGRLDEAMKKAQEALDLLPRDSRIGGNWYVAKANLAFRDGKVDDVIDLLEKAVKLDPGNRGAETALAMARSRRDAQKETVRAAFEETRMRLNAEPPSGSVVMAAAVDPRIAAVASLPRQAEEIERSPGRQEATQAFEAVAKHDWTLGLALYRMALQKDPNNGALQRMVDLGSYTLERQREAAYTKKAYEALDAYVKEESLKMSREDWNITHGPQGGDRSGLPSNPETREVLGLLLPTFRKSLPPPANRETPDLKAERRKIDEAFVDWVIASWAEEAGKRASLHLISGNRQEAATELRDASRMAPGVPNYGRALKVLTGPDDRRDFVGKRVHADLNFISN